ncbi:MAG: exosortase/archaeosortase family protein [Phycisphaerae bacterium]
MSDSAALDNKPVVGTSARDWIALAIWAVLLCALGITFFDAFSGMWRYHWFPAWNAKGLGLYDRLVKGDSYYTHAPLVPLVSILIAALLIRHTRIRVRPRPIPGGILLCGSLLLHLAGVYAGVDFVKGFAFVGVVAGLVLLLWGAGALRRLWFPIVLLTAMMPLPPMAIAQLSFRLKMMAANWGVALAGFLGVLVERAGSVLKFPGGKEMVVGDVCSGLRTLISLVAFGAIYAYVCRLRGWLRAGLFAMSIPVALISNCLRITALIVVADIWGVPAATGWFHDSSGVLTFLFALALMFGLERLVLWIRAGFTPSTGVVPLFHDVRRTDEDAWQVRELVLAVRGRQGVVAVMMVVLAVVGNYFAAGPSEQLLNTSFARDAFPAVLCVDSKEFVGQDMELDERTRLILRTNDYVYRRYVERGSAGDGETCDVLVTYSLGSRRATHPPDVCLEGGGSTIVAKGDVCVAEPSGLWRVPCRELLVRQTGAEGTSQQYFLYTYKAGSDWTVNWYFQQGLALWNSVLHRKAGVALLRISAPVRGDDVEDARRRSVSFMRTVMPHVTGGLP